MRHAKSAWDSDAPTDHERPLAPRGRRDAPRMARWLQARGWTPDAVVSSDATRAHQTAALLVAAWAPAPPVHLAPVLYGAGLGALRGQAATWDPAWQTVLALGHDPGWSAAVEALCGQPVELKTAACALLEGGGRTWAEALQGPWRLVALQAPRGLPD